MADRVKLNSRAIEALLKSPEVRRDLEDRARRGAASAGSGYAFESSVGATPVSYTHL